jgi:phosphate starvation-inducible protein PhoH and related proteins
MARKRSSVRKQRLLENDHLLFVEGNTPPQKFQENKALMPRNPNQVDAMRYLRTRTLTLLSGPPGTAKTLLATYVACEKLSKREIDKVYYVKPVVNVPGEQGLGFLPGNLDEKVAPHIGPLNDALEVFMPKGKAEYLISKKIIEFLPIEHLRGRSLNRCMVIADEMQNATTHSVMTILTRLGDSSSVAVLGDVVQRDLANRFGGDGLSDAVTRLKYLPDVGHIEFGFKDIERSPFVQSVIRAYADLYSPK